MGIQTKHDKRVKAYYAGLKKYNDLIDAYNKVSIKHSTITQRANMWYIKWVVKHIDIFKPDREKMKVMKEKMFKKYMPDLKALEKESKSLRTKASKIKTHFHEY